MRKLNAGGVTVLLTTHYLEEAQELCDRIAIINHGGIVANDTTANLLGRIDNKKLNVIIDSDLAELPENLRQQGWQRHDARHLSVAYRPSEMAVGVLLRALQMNGLSIADLTTEETRLEDIFLQLTRRKAAVGG